MQGHILEHLLAIVVWWPLACAVLRRFAPRRPIGLWGHLAVMLALTAVGGLIHGVIGSLDAAVQPAFQWVLLPFLLSVVAYCMRPRA